MKLIDNWQNKKLRCSVCGTDLSVKYQVDIVNPVESEKAVRACVCNKCAVILYTRI